MEAAPHPQPPRAARPTGWLRRSRAGLRPRGLAALAILTAWLTLTGWQPLRAAGPVDWDKLTLRDVDGESIVIPPAEYHVVCFLGTECPLARLYAARLQQLATRFADHGVAFLGVNSNLQDSPAEIDRYARDHGIEFPLAKDADQSVARALGATRTPEVFLVDSLGLIRYQGRIDDQYEPGHARSEPQHHDLRNAIEAVIAGRTIDQPVTPSVGCLITLLPEKKPSADVPTPLTFTRDIVPVLHQHCVECHRDGEIAPFALTDYDEVVGWGQMMLEVIDQGRMPPWHADPKFGSFVGERRMPPADRDILAAWIEQGMPEGDAADLPLLPEFTSGWQVEGSPDVEIAMRDNPLAVPAEGVVEYQYFVVDPQWSTDRWIKAAQVIPGDAAVVHHAIVFVRPPDGSHTSGIGWLGAYVPGQRGSELPSGHARRIPAGSKLVFQMHYTPNGRETEDRTRVGVWFADAEAVTHEVFTRVAIDHEFEIPPKVDDYPVSMRLDSFPRDSRLLGVTPHMHVRGKSFRLEAKRDEISETLLHVPDYDFNWQHWYAFREPIDLNTVDALEMTVTFDNSDENPVNPDPSEYVTWGDQTWEEMAIAFFDVAQPRHLTGDAERVGEVSTLQPAAEETQREAERVATQRRIETLTQTFLREMDQNGDGVVQRDEAPPSFQRFYFRNMDRNGDDRLDRSEIEASAAERI